MALSFKVFGFNTARCAHLDIVGVLHGRLPAVNFREGANHSIFVSIVVTVEAWRCAHISSAGCHGSRRARGGLPYYLNVLNSD